MLRVPAVALVALLAGAPDPAPPLLVSAALSLNEALRDCGAAFEESTGRRVTFNFGPSNVLARQIVHGAPVDVFVSADEAQMHLAEGSGAILPGSRRAIASNVMVVITGVERASRWSDPRRLAAPDVRRVAIGDPQAVPAGVYAKTWLERIGLWDDVEPKMVPAGSVRGALAAVTGGAVDAAIVYATDARTAREISVVLEITGESAPSITYPAAVVRRSRDPQAARRFIGFLLGADGQRILGGRGFSAPPSR
jgi:molybdate transport system substrate-binding protein